MEHRALSRASVEALELLGGAIRVGRLRRGWTVEELAARVGVSRPTIAKIERGDSGVAIGTAFEAAHLVGVPLFADIADVRDQYRQRKQAELALLPASVRPRREVSDDF